MDGSPQQQLHEQRVFFQNQETKRITFRIKKLKQLAQIILEREDAICDAIYADFKKPRFESLGTETQIVLAELKTTIRKLSFWSSPQKVSSSWVNFPSSDWIYHEPYGNVLVISPWNYPFQLAMLPLIGAIGAGNTVVLKPSEITEHTSKILAEIIAAVFNPHHVTVIEGGVALTQNLLKLRWDYIFFTGSSAVGKIIYESAAKHITPVTLELGGKNPCIVDETASIAMTAKRIVWGKCLNGGQTCVAPDYILVHESQKETLVKQLTKHLISFFGTSMEASPDLARIVNKQHFNRLRAMLEGEDILFGGEHNEADNFIAPTLVNEPALDSKLMQSEIFGPILPILSYTTLSDLDSIILKYEKPLSAYIFSGNKAFQQQLIHRYSFGGGAINDTVVQYANKNLPFGGVGLSGIGAYHGKTTFDVFSHKKAIVKKAKWLDIPLRYAPYKLPKRIAKNLKRLF